MKESKKEQKPSVAKPKQNKPGSNKKKPSGQACNNEKKKVNPSVKAEASMVRDNARVEVEQKQKMLNSVLLLPAIGRGNSRPAFPLEFTPDNNQVAMIILAVTSFVMSFVPAGTAAMANAITGCFLDDMRSAMQAKRSLFQIAPKVWWEIRFALTPCQTKSYSFNYAVPSASITYLPSASYLFMGDQPTSLVNVGGAASAAAETQYGAINIASADYDIASDCFAYGGKGLKLCANPFENQINHDPSAFSTQEFNTGAATVGFGACVNSSILPIDYNRYCNVLPRTRFGVGIAPNTVQTSTTQQPGRYAMMAASASVEIGHRMFCDFVGAPEEVRNFMPVCVRVDANDLVKRTMWHFNLSLLDGGVAASSITIVGSQNVAAYLLLAICEWFAPWSMVTYTRGYTNSADTMFYSATSGCMIQNLWKNRPIPAALAVNLSHLTPCVDFKLKRVYYPSLDLNLFSFANYVRANYTVFNADNNGAVPWTSFIGTKWAGMYDTANWISDTLSKYSYIVPLRNLPHTARVMSLACHVQMVWAASSPTITVVASTHQPTDEERELYTFFVLPTFTNTTNEQFFEYARFFGMRELTVLPNPSDQSSYQGFMTINNNPLSTSAKVLLETFDRSQEESSGWFGFLGTAVGGAGLATAVAKASAVGSTEIFRAMEEAAMGHRNPRDRILL